MRKVFVVAVLLAALSPTSAGASSQISIAASPNPAAVGQRVVHTVGLVGGGGLQVWVSARGFARPGLGTLPPGTWVLECCPPQTAGTPAWHYRSATYASAGSYRFGALAQVRGTYESSAAVGVSSTNVWVRIV